MNRRKMRRQRLLMCQGKEVQGKGVCKDEKIPQIKEKKIMKEHK